MRVQFVSTKYPPYIGGAQTQLQKIAQQICRTTPVQIAILADRDDDQTRVTRSVYNAAAAFVSAGIPAQWLTSQSRSYDDDGVKVDVVGATAVEKLSAVVTRGHSADTAMERHLSRVMNGASVIHCIKPDWLAFRAREVARRKRIPYVVTPFIHDRSVADDIGWLLKDADAVLALSEADRRNLIDIGIPAAKVRMTGVAPLVSGEAQPQRFRDTHGIGNDPMVLFLGRMIEYKGARATLAAASRVWDKFPATRFVFAGPPVAGSDAWFEQMPDARIVHLGRVSDADKVDALAACNVFCMPSTFEILPAVFLEAWTFGKPVIGGTAAGLQDLIEGNGAGFISSQEPAEIADKIVRLLGDPEMSKRMGAAGRALVDAKYNFPALAKGLMEIYSSLQH